jgi:hypothetical protein
MNAQQDRTVPTSRRSILIGSAGLLVGGAMGRAMCAHAATPSAAR